MLTVCLIVTEIGLAQHVVYPLQTGGLPATLGLCQNYPNPLNPTKVIGYQLPVSCYMTMKLYNVTGEEVKKLVNEIQQPGIRIFKFDGTNLPSGVYYYRMSAVNAGNSFSQTRKMTLLK